VHAQIPSKEAAFVKQDPGFSKRCTAPDTNRKGDKRLVMAEMGSSRQQTELLCWAFVGWQQLAFPDHVRKCDTGERHLA
jgi:hypothetical protein